LTSRFIASTWSTMVCTDLRSSAWSDPSQLVAQLVRHALGRQLDGRQRVLDLVREPARHLAPGLHALRRHHSEMSSNTSSRAFWPGTSDGISAPRATSVRALFCAGRPGRLAFSSNDCCQWSRMLQPLGQVVVELRLHGGAEASTPGHRRQRLALVRRQRHAQDAGGARVGRLDAALLVQHDHAGGEVVQDGLQVGARRIHLAHALLDGRARVGQLLRHVGERPRQAAEFVLALQHRLGRQVAGRHFAHAGGQQQQRPRQLVAQQHGQKMAPNTDRNRLRVSVPMYMRRSPARQRALLVFAVGLLHRDGVGHQRRRTGSASPAARAARPAAQPGPGHHRQRLDAALAHRGRGSARPGPR
jgi:hypothetical protein